MFSATKLVATAAAVALSGALLLAGPFTPQERSAPAAPDAFEPGVITPVQGTMYVTAQTRGGDSETYAGGRVSLDEWWTTRYEVDDPRLSGYATSRHNRNTGATTTYAGGTRMITARIDNDGGSWVGTGRAYSGPESSIHYQMLLEGQGGYEGLHAIIALDTESTAAPFEVTGAIISGDLPELPEAVPAPVK